MRILITGATGFIGLQVVEEALSVGHQVRVLARASSDVAGLPEGVEVVRGELGDAREAISGVEGVVHLAGIGGGLLRRGDRQGTALRRVNVEGTLQVCEAALGAGIERTVLVTSMWTMLRADLAPRSPYLASRLDSEHGALALDWPGRAPVILCPAFVVGARDRGPNFPGSIVLAGLRGRTPLAPPGGMTWISVRDTARMIVAALGRGEPGRRYLLGAEHWTHLDLLTLVTEEAGRRPPRGVVPRGLFRLGGQLGDLVLAAGGRRAPIPLGISADFLCLEAPLDCAPGWEALGEPRTPVREAVGEAIAWFSGPGARHVDLDEARHPC